MAVNWGLAPDIPGPLDILKQVGQQQLEKLQVQNAQRQFQINEANFNKQQRQDASRLAAGKLVAAGDLVGGRKESLAAGDLEFASQINSLSKEQREETQRQAGIAGSALYDIGKLPADQRAAAWQAAIPGLRAQGLDDEDFAHFGDLSDNGIRAAVGNVMTLSQKLERGDKDRDFDLRQDQFSEEKRRNRATEAQAAASLASSNANAAASRALTLRGQNLSAATAGITSGRQLRSEITNLRKEFQTSDTYKNFNEVREAGRQVLSLAKAQANSKTANPQNDTALVYAFMKMAAADGSVVREGEFNLVGRGAGYGERVNRALVAAQNGEALTPRMRRDLVSAANTIYTSKREGYNQAARRYRGFGADLGADPDTVAQTYKNTPKRPASPSQQLPAGWSVKKVD